MVAIKVCHLKDLETAEPEYFLDDNDIVWAYWGKEK